MSVALRRRASVFPRAIPTDFSGLQFWFAAHSGTWQDSARTVPAVATNDPVGAWDDLSGNGRHATQSTASARPLLRLAQLGSLPAIRFDGVNDVLSTAAIKVVGTDGAWTVFAVARSNGGGFPGSVVDQDDTTTGRLAQLIRYNAASTVESIAFGLPNVAYTDESGQTVADFDILCARRTTTSVEMFCNGLTNGSTDTTASSIKTSGATNATRVAIGARATLASQFASADIAEVFMYNRALSDSELAELM